MTIQVRRASWWGGVLLAAVAGVGLRAGEGDPKPVFPIAVASDAAGNIYIADPRLPGIYRRDAHGRLDVFFRGSAQNRTPLHSLRALAIGSEESLCAADSATAEIYRLVAGQPPEPLTGGALEVPTGLTVTPEGDVIVCDLRLGTVARVPKAGGAPVTIAHVPAPRGVILTANSDLVVLSMGPDQLVRVTHNGAVRSIVSGRPFRFPIALIADRNNYGYLVSDPYTATIWAVSNRGEVRPRIQGVPLVRPEGMTFDKSGALLVADPGAAQVFRITSGGDIEPLL